MSNTIDQMRRVFDRALEIAERKNSDYGDAWRDQGWRGNISRIFEKTKRLRTILWSGRNVEPRVNESVDETALDMINTLAFFILNRESGVEWGHEDPFGLSYEPISYPNNYHVVNGSEDAAPSVEFATESFLPVAPENASSVGVLPVREPGATLATEGNKPSPRKRTDNPFD